MKRHPLLFWVVLVAVLVVGTLVIGEPVEGSDPLDPDSTDPRGTRALVLLLDELGADVDITEDAPDDDHDVALVLEDTFDDDRTSEIEDWVEDGGTLVVADPNSPLHPFPIAGAASTGLVTADLAADDCRIAALRGVEEVDPSGGVTYRLPSGATGCFERDGGSFVAVAPRGQGHIVAIGGAGALVNGTIGEADNAVLAGALLAPRDGTSVAFLPPTDPVVGSGEATLGDLVGDDVRQALLQLVIAFLVYAIWRARRLGRPVPEDQPVELAASELIVAVGNLLHQAQRRDQAAAVLADDLRRSLARRLGLGPEAPAEEVAEVAAARTGLPVERLLAVLQPQPLPGTDALVAFAEASESIRQEVTRVR